MDRLTRLNSLMSGGQSAVAEPLITPDAMPQPPQQPSARLQRLVSLQRGDVQAPQPPTPVLTDTGTPERPDNIAAQYDDMFNPETGRDAVFIGATTKNPYNGTPLDKNVFRVDSAAGTLYTTNKAKADQYRQNQTDDVRASILGYNQPKSELLATGANNTQVVVVIDPKSGKRLFEEATSDPNTVIEKYQKQGYKNITVETPEQMQLNRTLPPQQTVMNDVTGAIKEIPEDLKIGTIGLGAAVLNAIKHRAMQLSGGGIMPDDMVKSQYEAVVPAEKAKLPAGELRTGKSTDLFDVSRIRNTPTAAAGESLAMVTRLPDIGAKVLEAKQQALADKQTKVTMKTAPITRLSRAVWQGGVPSVVASIGASLLTGDPTVGLMILGETTSGGEFSDQLKSGASIQKSGIYADLAGAAEIGGEMLVFPKFLKGLKEGMPLKKAFGLILENAGQEGATGFTQTFLNVFSKATTKGMDVKEAAKMAFDEGVKAIPENAFVGGATAGLVDAVAGTASAGRKISDKIDAKMAEKATDNKAITKQIAKDNIVEPISTETIEQGKTKVEKPAEVKADLRPDQFPVTEVPVKSLKLSKDVPNFKENANTQTGVVAGEELHGKYNRLGTAPILVWERNSGDLEVITGRHRLDLAKRQGEKTIPAQIVSEAGGFDKNMALTADAESNIRDGQGSIKDYAQYFRNTRIEEQTARERGLLSRTKGKTGFIIGKSAVDDVYARFLGGKLSESKTAAIAGGAVGNESAQMAAASEADNMSAEQLEQYAKILSRTKPSDNLKATQGNLFGFDESAIIEAKAVSREVSKETNAVKERILAVKGALKRPEIANKMGLKFSDETSIRQEVSRLEDRLEVLKRTSTTPELYDEMKRRAGLVVDTGTTKEYQQTKIAKDNIASDKSKEVKKIRHYTLAENIPQILKEGFNSNKPPVFGVGGLEGGKRTSKFGKDILYFTTDDKRWNTALTYVGEGKGDITRPAYDYKNQKWTKEKNAYKKTNLSSLEATIKPEAKILTVDNLADAEKLAIESGIYDSYNDIDSILKSAKEKGYDIVNFKYSDKWVSDKPDKYGEYDRYNRITGNGGKDDYFILNKNAVEIQSALKNKDNTKTEIKAIHPELAVMRQSTLPEYNTNSDIVTLDAFVDKIRVLNPKDELDAIHIKQGNKYEVTVSYPHSLGENGNATDFVYKEKPTVAELKTDIIDLYKREKETINETEASTIETPEHKKYIADAVDRYDKKYAYTHIVNADMAKQILPDYDPANIENERKYFGDAAEIAGKIYDKWIKDRKDKGNSIVLFMAGGTGSGKSTVANDLSRKVNYSIIVDSTLTSKDYAVDQIDKALKNGYNVAIRYIYRESADAWENGVWTRWLDEKGHFVPADVFVNTHFKARSNLIELAEKYGDKIQIEIDENQSGQNVKQISIDELKAKSYDLEVVKDNINEISKRQLEKHGIAEAEGFVTSETNTSDSIRSTQQKEPRVQSETSAQKQVEVEEGQPPTPPFGSSSIGDLALGNPIDSGRISVSLEPGNKPMPARDIVDYVSRAFNIPMRGKATHHKKALGWFDPKAVGIRMVDVRQLTTAMHEIGHHIDWTLNKRMSLNPPSAEIADELMAMGKALYGSIQPEGGYKSEGWAEFIRAYLTGEDTKELAPNLHKWFVEEYLPNNTNIANKLNVVKGMIDKWRLQGAESRIDSQISNKKIKGTLGERLERGMLWMDTMFRDEAAPLRAGMKKAGIKETDLAPDENPYQIYVSRADKAGAITKQFVLEYTTDTAGNGNGKGLREIIKPVRSDIPAFTRWIVAARARLLLSRGINPGISQADADYVYNKYDSELWQDVLKEITDWNHRVLDYLVEAGGMSDESAKRIKDLNPIYIPFMRAFKEGELHSSGGSGGGIAKTGKAVKSIKGSGREIIDPLESMIKQTEKIIGTAHKAEVAKALAKLADRPGMASVIWKVPAPMQATRFEAEQLKKDIARIAYERMGLDPAEISSAMLERWDEELTVFSNASHYYGKDNIISLYVDGKQQFYEVNPALYRALEGLDQYHLPWIADFFLGKPARMARLGATGLNASFGLIRNFIRDAMTFTVLSKHAKLGPVSAVSGIVKDVVNTEGAQKFKALGGKMSAQILADRRAAQHLKKHALTSTIGSKTIYTVAHPIDALRELFGVTEAGTRIGEFDAALDYAEKKWGKGSKAAAIYALNQAQDVTTNFTRHGKVAKILNQIIPFFNAAIQGPDKIVRTFRERPVSTVLKAIFALAIPAIWLWWKHKDKDWYKNMSDYEKYGYLHFEIPGTDKVVRLPVPFELGYIFQSAPVAALDSRYNKNPKEVEDMLAQAVRQANPFDWPATFGPVIDVLRNKDFAGRPIVSKSAEYKLPEDQYNKHTTELMKIIGGVINFSPAQLEYLVNSYSGGLYQRVSRTINLKDKEDLSVEDWPIISTLFLREPYAPKKQVEEFYERRDLLAQKDASKKITPAEDVERRQHNTVSKDLTILWKRLDAAKNDKDRKLIYDRMRLMIDPVNIRRRKTNKK